MNEPVIEMCNLTRYFGRKCAVNNVNLTIPRGSVFGFLGRNGSGKTTTIRMLLGLLEPTRGSARVLGCDSRDLSPAIRARIGYLAEGHKLYGWMRVREAERFQSAFHTRWNRTLFANILDYFRLARDAHVRTLSRGERAGLCLALTLATEPELLILDDPALGLDPVARRALVESMIYVTRESDRTILFSSHMLSDVERVADRIAILDRGRVRAYCRLDTFRDRVRRFVLRFATAPPELPDIPGLLHTVRSDNEVSLTVVNPDERTERVIGDLGADGVERVSIDLEDAFISYLGERGDRGFFLQEAGGAS